MQVVIMRYGAVLLLLLLVGSWGAWQRGSKESAYRALDLKKHEVSDLRVTIAAEARRRQQEQGIASGQQQAGNQATDREREIQSDYDERLAAALAGRDRDAERLRNQWASSATACLSAGAAAAGEAAETDRLRRASAARILRATELAQSERDEAVDLYQAVWSATNATP